MRLLRRLESPQSAVFAVVPNRCAVAVALLFQINTKEARLVRLERPVNVLVVGLPGHVSQVSYAVIPAVAVDVVNVVLGPSAMHVKPREARSPICPPANTHIPIAVALYAYGLAKVARANA